MREDHMELKSDGVQTIGAVKKGSKKVDWNQSVVIYGPLIGYFMISSEHDDLHITFSGSEKDFKTSMHLLAEQFALLAK